VNINSLDAPKKVNDHCLIGSTKVNTINGYTQIKDLVGTEGQVYTINSDGERCVRAYRDVRLTQEKAKIIKLIFNDCSELVVTPDHLILTTNGWLEAQDICFDDDIVTLEGTIKLSKMLDFGEEDVYNMEVEDTHCFAVTNSNIIVHNCVDSLRYGCMWLQPKNKIAKAGINIGI